MKRDIIFTAITYVLTWGLLAGLVFSGAVVNNMAVTVVFTACMFMPTLGSLLTRLFTRQGMGALRLMPRFKGNAATYLLACVLPTGLIIAGAAVYFCIFPAQFDGSMTVVTAQMAAAGMANPVQYTVVSLVVMVIIAPRVNVLPCLGEELGWRGYLQFQLAQKFSRRTAGIITGVIWGVWHAPMIALGHNYGIGYWGYPLSGILLFTVFCVAFGCFLSWLTWRAYSALPAAMAHSALNALAGLPVYFTAVTAQPSTLVGPLPVGLLAMVPFLAAGVFFFCKTAKKHTT